MNSFYWVEPRWVPHWKNSVLVNLLPHCPSSPLYVRRGKQAFPHLRLPNGFSVLNSTVCELNYLNIQKWRRYSLCPCRRGYSSQKQVYCFIKFWFHMLSQEWLPSLHRFVFIWDIASKNTLPRFCLSTLQEMQALHQLTLKKTVFIYFNLFKQKIFLTKKQNLKSGYKPRFIKGSGIAKEGWKCFTAVFTSLLNQQTASIFIKGTDTTICYQTYLFHFSFLSGKSGIQVQEF